MVLNLTVKHCIETQQLLFDVKRPSLHVGPLISLECIHTSYMYNILSQSQLKVAFVIIHHSICGL